MGMKQSAPGLALSAAMLASIPTTAAAAGFYVGEQSARATGTAGATTAEVRDASAVFYNPAAVAELDGLQLSLGGGVLLPSVSYEGVDGTGVAADSGLFFVPHGFLTYQPSPGYGVGVGVTAPFGLGIRWPTGAPGRFIGTEQTLRTLFISVVAAASASTWVDGLSLGLGIDLVPADAFLARDVPIGSAEGSVRLNGSALGIGFRFGVLYDPAWLSDLHLAFSGWGPVSLHLHGKVDFDAPPEVRSALPPDGTAAARMELPPVLTLGFAYDLTSWLAADLDASWFGWSSFRTIQIDLPDGSTSTQIKGWHDSFTVRVGLAATWGVFSARLGYAFDQSPIPADRLDPTLPDMDRNLLAAGAGLALPLGIDIDVAVLTIVPGTRQGQNSFLPGSYDLSAWTAQLTLGIALGQPDAEVATPDAASGPGQASETPEPPPDAPRTPSATSDSPPKSQSTSPPNR